MENPEITLQENIDVHCKYINTALDNLFNTEISFESVNQITGFLCAYDAFIIDFVYCIEPHILKDSAGICPHCYQLKPLNKICPNCD